MTIIERTINVTYKDTTKAISFVYNDNYSTQCQSQNISARVLYTFKDLIPDYQKYSEMKMPFAIYKDTEVAFELPALEFNFTIITIGHGTIEVKIKNEYCFWEIGCHEIYIELEKQIGITNEWIELCNEEGEEFIKTTTMGKNKMTLYAVIKSVENELLEKGYTIIEYKSVLTVGETMRLEIIDKIGNYSICKFYSLQHYLILKRTPKMVVFEFTRRHKIKDYSFGESAPVPLLNGFLVSKIDGIEYEKLYAIAF